MTDLQSLFDRYQVRLEDFWSRRQSNPRHVRELHLFGRPVKFCSNDEGVLAAADLCRPLYSVAPARRDQPFTVQLIVNTMPSDPGPAPDDLVRHIQYTGHGDWMAMQLGAWGNCQMDLAAGRATALLSTQLAARPDLVHLCILNTVLTNLFQASGLAMLHATCLLRANTALLLVAPHNGGKSTTALHMVMAGYELLSDSQVYVWHHGHNLQLMGFPVGRIKLRRDMVAEFPRLQPLLTPEQIRDETKYSLDLRQLDPTLVCENAIEPSAIELCLLSRSDDGGTHVQPAAREAVMEAVILNSLHYHTAAVWQRNLAALEALMGRARWHRLAVGSRVDDMLAAVARLCHD